MSLVTNAGIDLCRPQLPTRVIEPSGEESRVSGHVRTFVLNPFFSAEAPSVEKKRQKKGRGGGGEGGKKGK